MHKKFRAIYLLFALASATAAACSAAEQPVQQQGATARPDLYACEGCEAVHERDPSSLSWQARIASEKEPGEPMLVRGRVLQADGVTPASGVILYAHQTNAEGAYAGGTPESEWSRRHGRLRGWVKTGSDGRYQFATIKPAPYPTHSEPAHVHLTVLEPGRRPYWIDDVVFAGDYRVDDDYRRSRENRGGSGIVSLSRAPDGSWIAERDIILERHPG